MNKAVILGRLTRDPEIRVSQSGQKVAKYTLAVNRPKDKDGNQQADFISCVAFGTRADFAEKYMAKGRQFAVVGRIQTGSYTNREGRKVYTTNIIVDEHFFADSRPDTAPARDEWQQTNEPAPFYDQGSQQGLVDIDDFAGDDELEQLPF